MSTSYSYHLKHLILNSPKQTFFNKPIVTSCRSKSLNHILNKNHLTHFSTISNITTRNKPSLQSSKTDLFSNTFLIQNSSVKRKQKLAEHEKVFRSGSMKDLHRNHSDNYLSTKRTTSPVTETISHNRQRTINREIEKYTNNSINRNTSKEKLTLLKKCLLSPSNTPKYTMKKLYKKATLGNINNSIIATAGKNNNNNNKRKSHLTYASSINNIMTSRNKQQMPDEYRNSFTKNNSRNSSKGKVNRYEGKYSQKSMYTMSSIDMKEMKTSVSGSSSCRNNYY